MKRIVLAGGLGNQLFQYAFALTTDSEPLMDQRFGLERRDNLGKAEISNFTISSKTSTVTPMVNFVERKTVNFLIRQSTKNQKRLSHGLIEFFATAAISIVAKKFTRVRYANGVGYDPSLDGRDADLAVGYFQSYKWASSTTIQARLMSLKLRESSERFERVLTTVKSSPAVFCHIRLQDYLLENSFGVPSNLYIESALNYLNANSPINRILIFSDDPAKCMEYFPEKYRSYAEIVDDADLTSAEVLEVFRHGSDYVIANSTFSWWGAYLRYDRSARVMAPDPWFASGWTPRDLIPPDWHKVAAGFHNNEKLGG